jgi:antitoxin CptB
MNEILELMLKRLKIKSCRRGIKEMDLILGNFSNLGLQNLSSVELKLYDQLLDENDHDLYIWCSQQQQSPDIYKALLSKVMGFKLSSS